MRIFNIKERFKIVFLACIINFKIDDNDGDDDLLHVGWLKKKFCFSNYYLLFRAKIFSKIKMTCIYITYLKIKIIFINI